MIPVNDQTPVMTNPEHVLQIMSFLTLRSGLNLTRRLGSTTTRAPLAFFGTSALQRNAAGNRYKDELQTKQMANDNPFDTYMIKPEAGKGLFQSTPVLVPSTQESRFVYMYVCLFLNFAIQDGWMLL